MPETNAQPKERKATLIEIIMVISLMAIITIGAIQFFDPDVVRGALLRSRSDSLEATANVSLLNKAVVEGYTKCWQDRSVDPTPKCALDAVALGRSQGRTEAEISQLLGSMGVFEHGCQPDGLLPHSVLLKNQELNTLLSTWCQTQSEKQAS